MIKIYIKPLGNPVRNIDLFHYSLAEPFINYLSEGKCKFAQLADNATEADTVVLIENLLYKDKEYYLSLYKDPAIRWNWPYIFTINSFAKPADIFYGIYTSMPASCFVEGKHIANGYYVNPNSPITEEYKNLQPNPEFLFSFVGVTHTHIIRKIITEEFSNHKRSVIIPRKKEHFLNYSESLQSEYREIMSKSKFVLCPRGYASSSYRIYEAMQLGRVPVIISDEWVPPQGKNIDWNQFSIRIKENQIEEIPLILEKYEAQYEEMSRQARLAWESRFTQEKNIEYAIDVIYDLRQKLNYPRGKIVKELLKYNSGITAKSIVKDFIFNIF